MNKKYIKIIAAILIIIGLIFLMSGEPMIEDPTILEPTIGGMTIGLLLLVIGVVIIKRNK